MPKAQNAVHKEMQNDHTPFPMVAMQQIHVGYAHRCKITMAIPGVLLVLVKESIFLRKWGMVYKNRFTDLLTAFHYS